MNNLLAEPCPIVTSMVNSTTTRGVNSTSASVCASSVAKANATSPGEWTTIRNGEVPQLWPAVRQMLDQIYSTKNN